MFLIKRKALVLNSAALWRRGMNMKKYFSIALALILLLSTVSAAFAAGFDPITVQIPVEGTGIYKLTDLSDNSEESLEVYGTGAFYRTFSKRGNHSYELVSEEFGQLEKYSVQIAIDDDVNGNLVPVVVIKEQNASGKTTEASFTQSNITCENDPPVRKVVNGKDDCNDTFQVQMIAADASFPMPEGSENGIKTATLVGTGAFEFGIITFTEAGTYDYSFQEVNNGIDGYRYDDNTYGVRYVVSEVGQDTLTSERTFLKNGQPVENIEYISITNVYQDPSTMPTPVSDTPTATKTLTGIDNSDVEFEVTMTPKSDAAPMPEGSVNRTKTAKTTAGGEFNFGEIEFMEAGEFEYEFTETDGGVTGYTYDNNVYGIKYTVTANASNELGFEKTFTVNGEVVDGMTAIEIQNSYREPAIPITVIPDVSKVLEGIDNSDVEFEVVMAPKTGTEPMPEGTENGQKTAAIIGSGSFNFGSLVFTEPGVYEYEFIETDGGVANYTYDTNTYGIIYTVSANADNALIAEKTILVNGTADNDATSITITNTYEEPQTGTTSIQETPKVSKILNGIDASAETFEVTMTAKNGAPMPEGSNNGIKKATVTGSGDFDFGVITFTEPGTYEYEFTETDGGAANYTYDSNVYGATYIVYAGTNNELTLERSYSVNGRVADLAFIEFMNTYSGQAQDQQDTGSASIAPQVSIQVEGTDDCEEQFTAKMSPATDGMPMPEGSTNGTKSANVKGSGTFDFGTLTFTEPGTYEYNFKQENNGAEGYELDDNLYGIRYIVTKNSDGTLAIESVFLKNGEPMTDARSIVFTNTYMPQENAGESEPVTVVPSVAKVVNGLSNCTEIFKVKMTAKNVSNPMPDGSINGTKEASVSGSGQFNFGAIKFTEPGTYEYEFKEINSAVAGYTYDSSVFSLRYTVTADENNKLTVVTQMIKNGTIIHGSNQIIFTNKYKEPVATVQEPTATTPTTQTPTTYVTPTPYVTPPASNQTYQVGKTGDDSHAKEYAAVFVVTLAIAIGLTFLVEEKNKKEHEQPNDK
jgi:pilin isopeptide linkage protein